ncbi:uncharacterized protein PAC_07846 [Phialocephala subalpina]|uniref:Uncharacterized protein n=1 Tax=Phialocephala subalpina TaxID=576137 RepID=A0A1L7WYV7_9HELO|nr:uncharacterized protein PAC_07846 [Phialocephala subalpina]
MPPLTRRRGPAEHTGNTPNPNEKKKRARTRKEPVSKPAPDTLLQSIEDEDMASAQAQAVVAMSTTSRSESIHQDESRSTSPNHIDTQPSSSSPSAHAHPSQQTSEQPTSRQPTSEQQISEQQPAEPRPTLRRGRSATRSVSPLIASTTRVTRGTKRQRGPTEETPEDAPDADARPSQPTKKRVRRNTKDQATTQAPAQAPRGRGKGRGRGGRAQGTGKLQSIVEASPVKAQAPSENQPPMFPYGELRSTPSLIQPVVEGGSATIQAPSDSRPSMSSHRELTSTTSLINSIVEGGPATIQARSDNQPTTSALSPQPHMLSPQPPIAKRRLSLEPPIAKRRRVQTQPAEDDGYESVPESEVELMEPDVWRKKKERIKQKSRTARKMHPSTKTLITSNPIPLANSSPLESSVASPKSKKLSELREATDKCPNGWEYFDHFSKQMKSQNLPAPFGQPGAPSDEDANLQRPEPEENFKVAKQSQPWLSLASVKKVISSPIKFFGGAKVAGEPAATNAQKTDFTFKSSQTITIPATTGSSNTSSSNTGSSTAIPPATPTPQTRRTSRAKTDRHVRWYDPDREEVHLQTRSERKQAKALGLPIQPFGVRQEELAANRKEESSGFLITPELQDEFQEFLSQRRGKDHGERENEAYEHTPGRTFKAPDPNDESDESELEITSSTPPVSTSLEWSNVTAPPPPERDPNDDTYYFGFRYESRDERWSRLDYAEPVCLKMAKRPQPGSANQDRIRGDWSPEMYEWYEEYRKWGIVNAAVNDYLSELEQGRIREEDYNDIVETINEYNAIIKKNEDVRRAKAEASRAALGISFADGRVGVTSNGATEEIDRRARAEDSPEEEEDSVLQPKANAQTPPPPPRPSNAQLPGQIAMEPITPAKPMNPAFTTPYAAKKPSNLRYAEKAYSSPVEFEQENLPEVQGHGDTTPVRAVSPIDPSKNDMGDYFSGEEDVNMDLGIVGEVEWDI